MNKEKLEKIKNILKTYRNTKKYSNEEMAKYFGVKRSTMVGYIQKNRDISKVFLNKFIKEEDVSNEDKKTIINYLGIQADKNKFSDNVEIKLNEILSLLYKKELSKEDDVTKKWEVTIDLREKRKELEELERKIKLKRFEYEKLERTSGARSKITWACIDIQKFNSEKITEIINILGIIDVESRKKAYPALKQLHIHLESFSENIKKVIKELEIISIK